MKPLQRIACVTLAFVFLIFAGVPACAADGFTGFTPGGWSHSRVPFGFEDYEAVVVYNGDVYDNPDYNNIWPGSAIYVPVYTLGESGQQMHIATDKEIKDNEVALSYKVLQGDRFVDSITLVDGKKEKIKGIDSGTYAKIAVNTLHTGIGRTELNLKMVLSVKKIAYPDTQIELDANLYNRLITLYENTVYPAQSPTQFYSLYGFAGTPTFDFGGGVKYTSKVAERTRYYLNLDKSDQPDISRLFPDAYLEFYNFRGTLDSFSAVGTLEIPVTRSKFTADKEQGAKVYAYEVTGNTLTSLGDSAASFDGAKNILTIKTASLGNYILSSTALTHTIDGIEEKVLYSGYSDGAPSQPAVRESAPETDNVNTGRGISAANISAQNPLTSDTRPIIPVLVIFSLSGAALAVHAAVKIKRRLGNPR